jgi:hypothetical protein
MPIACATEAGFGTQTSAAGAPPAGARLRCKGNLQMRQGVRTALGVVWLFLLVQFALVHCFGPASPALAQRSPEKSSSGKKRQPAPPSAPQVRYGTDRLPGPVQDMREAILSAVRSGRIEELRHAWELNELKPDLGVALADGDPIAHWKRISGDGEGREVLAALGEILDSGYVVLPLGRDLENNKVYVWPYFAEVALDKLTPTQEVELLRLVTPAALKDMRAAGKYTHWRIAIGADGTWHSFRVAS